MARVIQTDRAKLLNAALKIVDERGWEAVSAREIAAELGISTQPIYRQFADMNALKIALIGRGWEEFVQFLVTYSGDGTATSAGQSNACAEQGDTGAEQSEMSTEQGKERARRAAGERAALQSAAYVRFAVRRKNLFRFLFSSQRQTYSGLTEISHKLVEGTGIIDALERVTGLPREQVYRMHLYSWMAMHGLANMGCVHDIEVTDGELTEFTRVLSRALTEYFARENI